MSQVATDWYTKKWGAYSIYYHFFSYTHHSSAPTDSCESRTESTHEESGHIKRSSHLRLSVKALSRPQVPALTLVTKQPFEYHTFLCLNAHTLQNSQISGDSNSTKSSKRMQTLSVVRPCKFYHHLCCSNKHIHEHPNILLLTALKLIVAP